jgi:hypothetical protein
MAKIPLTIDKNYCAGWGVWHGVRELLQNAKDAEDYEGKPMIVTHYPRTYRLEITTRDTYVQPSNLLVLGKTSKADGRQRGKFGEGFVLGVLALIRKGCNVTFRNGDLSWSASFESPDVGHPLEGNELLTFKSRTLQMREANFKIEIEGITEEAWDIIRGKVLFLEPPKAEETLRTNAGALLLNPRYKGDVFVRGLYVRTFEDLSCGYDLDTVSLDRDRQMIDEWDLHYALGKLWSDACNAQPELATQRVYELAKEGSADARYLKHHADDKLIQQLRDKFEAEHGKDCVPVSDNTAAREAQGTGSKPVMVNSVMKDLLEKGGLSLDAVKKAAETTVEKRWAPADFLDDDAVTLTLLESIAPTLAVVTFRGNKPGVHLIDENKTVAIDHRLLDKPRRELITQVVAAEAQRLGVIPLDVLIAHVAGEPLQSKGAQQESP